MDDRMRKEKFDEIFSDLMEIRNTWYWIILYFRILILTSNIIFERGLPCQTDTAVCLLASTQLYLFDIRLLLYVQS